MIASTTGSDSFFVDFDSQEDDSWYVLYEGGQTFHPADTNTNGFIESDELFSFIERWKRDEIGIGELIDAIRFWRHSR